MADTKLNVKNLSPLKCSNEIIETKTKQKKTVEKKLKYWVSKLNPLLICSNDRRQIRYCRGCLAKFKRRKQKKQNMVRHEVLVKG